MMESRSSVGGASLMPSIPGTMSIRIVYGLPFSRQNDPNSSFASLSF